MPSNYKLLQTNVPISEAPVFSNRNYNVNEITAYGNYLYQKLANDEVFETFNNRKYYIEGDYITESSVNYVCILSTTKQNPSIDTTHWSIATILTWANATNYSLGQIVSFNSKEYLCLRAHTSSPLGSYKDWVYGQSADYYAGTCTYNGRYYKNTATFRSNTVASFAPPSSNHYYTWQGVNYYIWQDITDIVYNPSTSSEFWQEVSATDWNEKLFYGVNDVTKFNNNLYKCIVQITNESPSTDTTHWKNTSNKIPSTSDSWKRIATLNRFKMFDQFLSTSTIINGNIEFMISASGADSIYLGNIYADSIQIDVIDNNTGLTIETYEDNFFNPLSDWQEYFYGEWITQRKSSVLYERKTLTTNITFDVKLIGNVCSCGIFMVGKSHFIGNTQWEITDESLDYSTTVTDTDTGETYLSQGNEAPLLQIDLFINTSAYDAVKKKLKDARGIPVLFYDTIETTRVYGFIQKRSTILSGPVKTIITLNIQGLI